MSKENPNKGKPIYYKNEKHFIAFEMQNHYLISASKDLSKMFCLGKKQVSIKPNKYDEKN